jgi:hypothetical protein
MKTDNDIETKTTKAPITETISAATKSAQIISTETIRENIANYLVRKEEWIFVGIILAFSLATTESALWTDYLTRVARYCIELSPILVLKYFQPVLTKRFSRKILTVLWLIVFVVYPLSTLTIDLQNPQSAYFLATESDIFMVCAIAEILLLFNQSFKNIAPLKGGLEKLGMDGIILLFMAVISIYLGLLGASDLALWSERNALSHPIRFAVVWENFGSFISLVLQFFCLYFAGFILYWVNRYILVKRVLIQRGGIVYLFSVLFSVALLYPLLTAAFLLLPINQMGEPIIPAEAADPFDPINGRVAMAIMLVSLPVILVVHWHKKNNQLIAVEKQKSVAELELLKQQINPHFFFNTLNNLYALCLKKSEQAPEVVLQLSELMRFVVYQGQQSTVSIQEEIKYIEDYVNLQSLRLRNKLDFTLNKSIDNNEAPIAPLLLIILVENAFKHGIEPSIEKSELSITITLEDNQLIFCCVNSIASDSKDTQRIDNQSKGVGLENLKKRLMLLYPNQHQIELDQSKNRYTASLSIDLTAQQVNAL